MAANLRISSSLYAANTLSPACRADNSAPNASHLKTSLMHSRGHSLESYCSSSSSSIFSTKVSSSFLPLNVKRSINVPHITCMAWTGALASVRLIIQGKHMELTDTIKSYIEEKIGHAVKNHCALVKEVDVRSSVRGGGSGKGPKVQRVEVTIYTKKHGVVRAEEETESLYASIDRVSDVLTRKLRKIKEKDGGQGRSWQMRHQPSITEFLPLDPIDITPILNSVPQESPEDTDEIVRTKYFDMPPLDDYEALNNLINLGHDFYAFRNAQSGEINVIYKRKHGGYGIIVPRNEGSWEKKKE